MAMFERMTRDQLADWYEKAVGYNPIAEDAGLSTEDLRTFCVEIAGMDALVEAETAGRPWSYV